MSERDDTATGYPYCPSRRATIMLEYGEIEQASRLRRLLLPPLLAANTYKKIQVDNRKLFEE